MSDTQIIKDKIDVVDLIGEYVQMKPAGINHKGLCPFHQEKSPSFMANRERQSWHCFGCAKGGDIFTFVQDIENMSFVEALNFLAHRAGVVLDKKNNGLETSQKNRIKEINAQAARFFHNFLTKMPQSKDALDYLYKRGLSASTIEEWKIGFVSDQWDLLTQYLLKKGHSIDDLVAAGLTIKKDGQARQLGKGFYDRFRGRIMFPIWDVHGLVLGFTGRILVATEKTGGKYVNTPQTLVYDKSRIVFGLNFAKKEIRDKDLIVMVEGQTDVISAHQIGMKNVVASSGTALTEHQINLLKRYSNNLNIAFDADLAGQAAAKRGIDLALEAGINVKVIKIPDGQGKDPDECIKQNPDNWLQAVKNAQHIMEWYLNKAVVGKNMRDLKQKQLVVDEVLPEISRVPYAVERDHWMRELAGLVGVDVSVIREDITRLSHKLKPHYSSVQVEEVVKSGEKSGQKSSRLELLSERLIMLLLRYFGISNLDLKPLATIFTHNPLYEEVINLYTTLKSSGVDSLRQKYQAVETKENPIDLLLMKGELEFSATTAEEAAKEAVYLVEEIITETTKKKRKEFQVEIAQAEKDGDQEKLKDFSQKFQSL